MLKDVWEEKFLTWYTCERRANLWFSIISSYFENTLSQKKGTIPTLFFFLETKEWYRNKYKKLIKIRSTKTYQL